MSEAKPSLARDGTMQVTAKEGIGYLEREGHEKLLKMQGLKEDEAESSSSDKPSLARDSTMAVTAKEGEQFLEAGGGVDADAFTRGQQKKIEDLQSETAEAPSPKKPKMSKEGTMAVTAKEGKGLLNNEKLGDTRQETKAKAKAKPAVKKEGTMAKTVMEAKTLIGDDDLSGGRRTRSRAKGGAAASPPKPAVKRAGTMQRTAKDGEEFVNRKKGGKSEEDKEDEDEEEEKVE